MHGRRVSCSGVGRSVLASALSGTCRLFPVVSGPRAESVLIPGRYRSRPIPCTVDQPPGVTPSSSPEPERGVIAKHILVGRHFVGPGELDADREAFPWAAVRRRPRRLSAFPARPRALGSGPHAGARIELRCTWNAPGMDLRPTACAVPKSCACLTCCFTLGVRADPSRLSVYGPGVRLAGAPGAQ
jgi:hypothetical protein